jgi:hypothetical protein
MEAPASDPTPNVWVQLGPDGAFVRAATSGVCPTLSADGVPLPLRPRAERPPPNHSLAVCEAPIPPGTKVLTHDGRALPLPRKADRIVIVGDTGCRMKGRSIQNCTGDGEGPAWAFPAVAQAIAQESPDLIVHVGDYHYREARCPKNDPRCIGLATGYTSDAWQQDFLDPARPMLDAAPLLAVRGNHEDCDRAWGGWSWYLAPGPVDDPTWQTCDKRSGHWTTTVDGLQLVSLDTAKVKGWKKPVPKPKEVARYREAFDRIRADLRPGPTFFFTHRPIWGLTAHGDGDDRQIAVVERTLQHAGAADLKVDAVFGGHLHVLQHVAATAARPDSFVSGAGGTRLSTPLSADLLAKHPEALAELGIDSAGLKYDYAFGYLIAERTNEGYIVSAKNLAGGTLWTVPLPSTAPPTTRRAPPGSDRR